MLSLRYQPSDGSVCILQADPYIEIPDLLVEQAQEGNASHVSAGDGIVTFHSRHYDISYGLLEHNDSNERWLARRSDWTDWDEENPTYLSEHLHRVLYRDSP